MNLIDVATERAVTSRPTTSAHLHQVGLRRASEVGSLGWEPRPQAHAMLCEIVLLLGTTSVAA